MDTEFNYAFAKVIPKDHPKYINFQNYTDKFGEGGNTLVVATQTSNFFQKDFFNDWYEMGNNLKQVDGIQAVLSVPHSYRLIKNEEEKKFEVQPLIEGKVEMAKEMDSIRQAFMDLPFYHGLVYNQQTNATLMALTFKQGKLSSDKRVELVEAVKQEGKKTVL